MSQRVLTVRRLNGNPSVLPSAFRLNKLPCGSGRRYVVCVPDWMVALHFVPDCTGCGRVAFSGVAFFRQFALSIAFTYALVATARIMMASCRRITCKIAWVSASGVAHVAPLVRLQVDRLQQRPEVTTPQRRLRTGSFALAIPAHLGFSDLPRTSGKLEWCCPWTRNQIGLK